MNRSLLSAAIFIVTTGISCKKAPSQSPDTLLTTKKWYPSSVAFNGEQTTMPPCEQNCFLIFQTNDTGLVDESACAQSATQEPFTYSLATDAKTIYLQNFFGIGSYTWTIVKINSSVLEIMLTIPILSGPDSNTAETIDYTFTPR